MLKVKDVHPLALKLEIENFLKESNNSLHLCELKCTHLYKKNYSLEDIFQLLNEDIYFLIPLANYIALNYVSNLVHLRAIVEFSNSCRKRCIYCGLNADNSVLKRYKMKKDEILNVAKSAIEAKCYTIVFQSGEDLSFSTDDITYLIKEVKNYSPEVAITLSLGEREFYEYEIWRKAGADRYLLKQETYNRKLFAYLHPDDDFDIRMQHRKYLKKLGYQAGTGNMVGLPGQTLWDLALDIKGFLDEDADMIGIGPFLAHPDTPLKDFVYKGDLLQLTLKVVAVTRIVTKDTLIPATTAMATLDIFGREKAFMAGANVVMPNFTPVKYKPFYEIYPEKVCILEELGKCVNCLKGRINSVNKVASDSRGDRYG